MIRNKEITMRKTVIYTLILSVLTLTAAGCGKAAERGKKEEVIPVRVMKVKVENISKTLDYVGNIKGMDEALVYPKVTGKIIEKVKDDGSEVKKGEAIAYIDRDEVGLKFEKAPVESPLDGVVGRIYVDIGSSVTVTTPIALVANMDRAEIDLDIPEAFLPYVSIGQRAEIMVDAYPDEKFAAIVAMVSPMVDLQTRAAPIKLVIDNADHRLQSGMFAKVRLVIGENKNSAIILKEAIVGRKPDTYVYAIEGSIAHLVKVELGIRQGPYYEVTQGLKEGDRVVIMGQQKLRDGATVAVEEQ